MTSIGKIQKKIDQTKRVATVITTMKNISFVNITHYNRKVKAAQDYFYTIERGFQILLQSAPIDMIQLIEQNNQKRTGKRLAAVVIGSERGLCGEFNKSLKRHFVQDIAAFEDVEIVCIGYKIASRLANYPIDSIEFPHSLEEINGLLHQLLQKIEGWLAKGNIQEIRFYYHRLDGGQSYHPVYDTIFPLNIDWLEKLKASPWHSNTLPCYGIGTEELFYELTQEALYIRMYNALIQSIASENTGRLINMQTAQHNIEDQIDTLTRDYHLQRQSQITEELFDIVSGLEILNDLK